MPGLPALLVRCTTYQPRSRVTYIAEKLRWWHRAPIRKLLALAPSLKRLPSVRVTVTFKIIMTQCTSVVPSADFRIRSIGSMSKQRIGNDVKESGRVPMWGTVPKTAWKDWQTSGNPHECRYPGRDLKPGPSQNEALTTRQRWCSFLLNAY